MRPSASNYLVRSFYYTPDGVSIKGFPLHAIINNAFVGMRGYDEDRILGEPRWAKSELYDIQAKVDEADVARWEKLPVDQQQLALRQLIEERFKLRFHRMSRISSVYVLSVGKGGPKMKLADHRPHMVAPDVPGHLESHSTYMWQLTEDLENQLNCIVRDETGLQGTYDYELDWTPDDAKHSESLGPSLFTAMKEQIGLKLELQRRPLDVMYIDHIERPSPN